MKKLLKKIGRLGAINWSTTLQYRADMILWLLADAATPLISMAVWYTVAKSATQGPTPQQTLNYYILIILVAIATSSWVGFFLSQEILNGTIVQRLIKPISPFWGFITSNLAEKVFRFSIPAPLFVLSLIFFPSFYVPTFYQLKPWLLFILSVIIAACLAFFIDMIFGLASFWLEDAINLRWYKDTLQMITSGILIPIAVMPHKVQAVVNVLPFRSIITTPIEILLGHISGPQLTHALLVQITWATATGIIMAVMWKQGLKRYAPPGQ